MSTDSSQSINIPEFGERMRDAFKGATNAEIARILKITPTAVGNHIKGRVTLSVLLGVLESTGCSADWLLTGKGSKYLEDAKNVNLDETFRHIIREVVQEEIKSSDRHVGELPIENIKNEKKIEKDKTPSPKK